MSPPVKLGNIEEISQYSLIEDCEIGKNTVIRNFVNLYGCKIGDDCRIASFVEIQRGVTIGDRCKVEAFAFIPTGVRIDDEVFIGPHVVFTNDKKPRAIGEWAVVPTYVRQGASIGAGSVVVCGVNIGERAMVGAGSVVTKDVPPGAVVYGNPAKLRPSVEDRS